MWTNFSTVCIKSVVLFLDTKPMDVDGNRLGPVSPPPVEGGLLKTVGLQTVK